MGFRLLAPSMLQHHVLATAGRVWMEQRRWQVDRQVGVGSEHSKCPKQGSLSDSWLQLQDRVRDEEVQVCEG